MAKYLGQDGKKHNVNLLNYEWELMSENAGYITVYTPKELPEDVFKYENDLAKGNNSFSWLKIKYHYDPDDVLKFNPIYDSLQYSIGDRFVWVELSKRDFFLL